MKKIFFVLLLLSGKLFANTITVSSIAELQSAIDKAKPGDKIVVKDGVYTTTSDISNQLCWDKRTTDNDYCAEFWSRQKLQVVVVLIW